MKKLENSVAITKQNDKDSYEIWEKQNKLSKLILAGDLDAYITLLEDINFSSDLGGIVDSFNIKTSDKDIITIQYDINIEGIIPEQYMTLTKTGKGSIKNYTKTAYYEIIKQYICGFAIRIARNIFGLLPVKTVVIHTQTNILNTQIGNLENNTILSIMVDRNSFENLNFDLIDPYDALSNFKHIYKEGYNLAWAYPLDHEIIKSINPHFDISLFEDLTSHDTTFLNLCLFCNITKIPMFQILRMA
ncbi:hypothetical protein CIW83_13610 [Tissierella sp. P1]|uniref:hypothetical protein n=1 Tax=Tissierella sp. P1 TaxID=1280483 RepID=UPI000BA0FCC2|nr:hypothetical protein [Tissierella sp. P1]OZV11682.1 hypothetical protein CIW83_13610 [Tissierella sp. P1]